MGCQIGRDIWPNLATLVRTGRPCVCECACVCVLLSVCVIKGSGLFVLLCAFIGGVVATVTQSVMSLGWVRRFDHGSKRGRE